MNIAWSTDADVVRVSGEQAEWYLQGQLSISVVGIESFKAKLGLLLEPDGSLVAPVDVCRDPSGFALYCPRGSGEAVVGRLTRFRLRTKASFNLSTGSVLSFASTEPGQLERLIDPVGDRHPDLVGSSTGEMGPWKLENFYIDSDSAEVASFSSSESLEVEGELARIVAGVPAWGKEILPGINPMELGKIYVRGHADFTKGCYTGQELIERVDSRGYNTPRRYVSLAIIGNKDLDIANPIEVIDKQGKKVFTITSASRYPEFDCSVGLGFSHRYAGSFLERFDFDNFEIVSGEPGKIIEYLGSRRL